MIFDSINTVKKKETIEPVATNRKARHDFFILETFEAGIALEGPEVKSLRLKQATITQGFARVEKGEVLLYGLHIAPYAYNTIKEIDPLRTRKLLLKHGEIKKLGNATSIKGNTLVALEIYFKKGWAKVLLGLAKGKNAADRHEAIKKRDVDRELRRELGDKFKG
ncbi:MAG: SsrA-binding protein [Elusimicrobia bacterium GWC2_51_8]|nr:MAG: SsrA-binding protein [Elusimicrobia bacterium GWA2_51_34]OGR60987.1 MAG: SsrA-binding protein [Elusimicrobia bacterium GWC2_51_8]